MKAETIVFLKDSLTVAALAGTLGAGVASFVGKVNQVPQHEKAIKSIKRDVRGLKSMSDFLVKDVERRTGKRYAAPIIRDDEE